MLKYSNINWRFIIFIYTLGVLPGEMSAKVVAKCFWHHEVEEELRERGLREEWVFTSNQNGENTGTHDDVMEFVDRKRCEELYHHVCSPNCKEKGKYNYVLFTVKHYSRSVLSGILINNRAFYI